MIVTCERCASQFRLDESKISSTGVRLRCSHCEHAFFVASPHQPEADHAQELVRDVLGEAISDKASGPPIESEDSLAPDTGEDDWEFNDDRGAMASEIDDADPFSDELTEAREAVDDLLGDVSDSGTSMSAEEEVDADSGLALDLDDDVSLEAGTEFAVDGFGDSRPELIAGSEPAAIAPPVGQPTDQLGTDPADAKSLGGFEGLPEFEAEPQESGADDFEDPADWDLFDSETTGPVAVDAFEPNVGSQSAVPDSAAPIGARRVALTEEMAPNRSKMGGRVLAIAGWLAVASLLVFNLAGWLLPWHPPTQPSRGGSVVAAGFDLEGVSARWIDNAVGGRLYVISGKLRRSQGSTPWDVTHLAVRMLDANGRTIDLPLAAVGPKIPERFLRETSPDDLVALQSERAAHFAATADGWLSFAAVVPTVPGLADRFEFSTVKPAAGS